MGTHSLLIDTPEYFVVEGDLSVCHVDGKSSSSGSFSLKFVWCFHAQLYNIWVARLTPNLVRSQDASAIAAT